MQLLRILIVDDQPDVVRTLGAIVTQGGYDTVTLSRFEDARRFIDETPPDALITDVRLGPFNGLQLVLHMRQSRPDAPVIVLSAYDDAVIRQETERAGAYFVPKPVTRQQLLDALSAVFDSPPPAVR
jgi:DNA-binding NtrC family response regulator